MSHDKCLNCGFELPDSPREKRYMAGLGSLQNAETEALVAANKRIAELGKVAEAAERYLTKQDYDGLLKALYAAGYLGVGDD